MSDRKPALLSKYRLLACLGRGGMAEVYLAVSEQPHGVSKVQVLKTLRRDLSEAERPEYLQMFQDEARLAARLNHPNIVQSHDVGFDEPTPFIAMEYLDGQALSRVQERQWSMGQRNGWSIELLPICQVLDALEYAHTLSHYDGTPLNVVHRDVSPQNIFITYTGHTKLVDFGIAKTLDSKKTRAGVIKGKVAYMSPEQVRGLAVDHRSDLYSVGVILWETVARQCMHGQEPVLDILNRVVEGRLPRLQDISPDAPSELCLIAERALACNPEQRYPNASAFREALDRFLAGNGRATERDLGKVVSDLFAKERSEINQAIRQALAQPASIGSDPDTLRLTPMLGMFTSWNESATPNPAAPAATPKPAPGPFETHTEKPVHLMAMQRSKGPRLWLLMGALPLTALLGWFVYSRASTVSESESPDAAPAIQIGHDTVGATAVVSSVEAHAPAMTAPIVSSSAAPSSQGSALHTSPTAALSGARPSPAAKTGTASPAQTTTTKPLSVPARPATTSPRTKDPFDHDFSPSQRKRSSGGTLDTSNPWK